jgi:hypothetical protein
MVVAKSKLPICLLTITTVLAGEAGAVSYKTLTIPFY